MKKSLLLFLVIVVGLLLVGLPKQKDVNASSDVDLDIYEMIDEFYNDGNYTKKSNIYLEPIVLEELAKQGIKAFHGKVDLERTTYYLKDDSGKDLLFMANLDGTYANLDGTTPVDGINSGYRTVTNEDGSTYMDHFVYDGTEAIRTYKTNIPSVEDYYVTLYDFLEEGQYQNEWFLNNGVYERILADNQDQEFINYLAFTAPCLEYVFFTDDTQNYFTIWDMKLSVSIEDGYFGEYLSLKLYAAITGENEGTIYDKDGVISEARIYKGTQVFDEADAPIEATIADVLAGTYEVGTKVTFIGEVSGIYQAWNTTYNNMSLYVQDLNGKEMVVFRTPYQISANVIVRVTGEIGTFNNVYQIAEGSKVEVITDEVSDDIKHQYEIKGLNVEPSGTIDFTVPVVGKYGTPIVWSCDVQDALTISETGEVKLNRGEEDVDVELIANIGNTEKVFLFTIKADTGGEPVLVEKVDTLSFASTANRTEFTSSKQVWVQNGITLINDKASSSSAVADYANPARFYAGSSITIECANISKIVVVCNSSSYATALKNSLGTISGVTVNVSGSNVTITFSTNVDVFKINKLTAQVRVNSITVTHLVTE